MKNKPATDDGSKTSLILSIRGVEEKKNYLHREEKERKHVDTDNTIVRERTRREEERKYFEVQSFVSYRWEPRFYFVMELKKIVLLTIPTGWRDSNSPMGDGLYSAQWVCTKFIAHLCCYFNHTETHYLRNVFWT